MKLYIFQETGEFRVAAKGEWYQSMLGDFFVVSDRNDSSCKRKIFVRTEVKISDKTKYIRIASFNSSPPDWPDARRILIIGPKKTKVKKWQWLYRKNDGTLAVTTPYEMEEEALAFIKELTNNSIYTFEVIRKLEESEIEVEE